MARMSKKALEIRGLCQSPEVEIDGKGYPLPMVVEIYRPFAEATVNLSFWELFRRDILGQTACEVETRLDYLSSLDFMALPPTAQKEWVEQASRLEEIQLIIHVILSSPFSAGVIEDLAWWTDEFYDQKLKF